MVWCGSSLINSAMSYCNRPYGIIGLDGVTNRYEEEQNTRLYVLLLLATDPSLTNKLCQVREHLCTLYKHQQARHQHPCGLSGLNICLF